MKDNMRTLRLVIEKADKLERLKFTKYFYDRRENGVSLTMNKEGVVLKRQGPSDEMIDAFILTLRFFIQDNEPTSFANIEKLFSSLPVEPARIAAVVRSRKVINDYLDQESHVVVSERLTKRYIFEVFLWGGLAHANSKRKEVYDTWSALPIFLFLQLEFTSVLVELLRAIFWFRLASKEAVTILESQTSKLPNA